MIVPVILSGGSGSRLWPLSRELYPKQLLPLLGSEHTMLQETFNRLDGMDIATTVVVCNDEHRFMVAEQLKQCGCVEPSIILEPEGRNTAPAIAIAALNILEKQGDALMLILPADHQIIETQLFHNAVTAASAHAANGKLVTFGIVPITAHTGYGYIRAGESLDNSGFRVSEFVEKPDTATAEKYLEQGGYYWNSGMFLFNASSYLDELERSNPAMLNACRLAYAGHKVDYDFIRLDREAFLASPSDSIDYAVMENTTEAVVLPLDAGWSDVGSWSAMWQIADKDKQGNVIRGDVHTDGASNSYLHAESRFLAVIGVDDLVVVETGDAVLVAHKNKVQDVKNIVTHLKKTARQEALLHRRVTRPWGCYESIDEEERFKVKRIMVKPGASLSLQTHNHRAEHWVVVKGTARVTKGDETFLLSENQSTYIPIGTQHRLENPGKINLEIVEVQSGSYLGEDDIERFEDHYGRSEK